MDNFFIHANLLYVSVPCDTDEVRSRMHSLGFAALLRGTQGSHLVYELIRMQREKRR